MNQGSAARRYSASANDCASHAPPRARAEATLTARPGAAGNSGCSLRGTGGGGVSVLVTFIFSPSQTRVSEYFFTPARPSTFMSTFLPSLILKLPLTDEVSPVDSNSTCSDFAAASAASIFLKSDSGSLAD